MVGPRPVSQLEKDTFVSWWDPGNPTFFDGFRFAEVLLNRETAFGPLGFGGFRALSDFRVRGIPPEPWMGLVALSNAQGGQGGAAY